MSIGRNEFVTRNYAERMISKNTANLRNQVKDIQEQINQWDIDFAGLQEKLKQLEQPNTEIQDRLNELIESIESKKFVTALTQSESESRLNTFRDSVDDNDAIWFFASADKLPVAINHLILEVLKYVLNGKQD